VHFRIRTNRVREVLDDGRRTSTYPIFQINKNQLTYRHQNEEEVGMIPRAIDMIFSVSSQLKDRGWKYEMEGQFLEVYNDLVSVRCPAHSFDRAFS